MIPHMNLNACRRVMLAAALIGAVVLAGCGRAPVGSEDSPETPIAEQAADGAVAVPACAQDCGEGITASIQCAAGEIAECSCDEGPRARCAALETGR